MTHHAQSTETSHNATNTNRKEMRRNARMGQTRYSTKIDASKMTVGQKYSENGKEYVWVGKETLRLIDKYIVENIESLAAEAGIPYPRRGLALVDGWLYLYEINNDGYLRVEKRCLILEEMVNCLTSGGICMSNELEVSSLQDEIMTAMAQSLVDPGTAVCIMMALQTEQQQQLMVDWTRWHKETYGTYPPAEAYPDALDVTLKHYPTQND
jgi:hypothetical protein